MGIARVRTGLDNLIQNPEKYKGLNLGLLTSTSGITSDLIPNIEALMEKGLSIVKLFGPEHGIWGAVADGERVEDEKDPRYDIPVYSLYGEHVRPTPEMLEGLDGVIYDIQDVGLRFYTFIYSLAYMMEECGKRGIKVIVLDRPNPISGKVEGPLIEKEFETFVGGYDLALRYGLTIGELANYFNETFKMNVDLEVIKMTGWKRNMYYDETGLEWPTPSPNLPALEHTILYTGLCLLEGVNVSVGRGTVHPFKYVGAPWIDSKKLYDEMSKISHPGIAFRERSFIPFSAKFENELCHGLDFYIADRENAEPLKFTLDFIHTIMKLFPEDFKWDTAYHEAEGMNHFDRLIGSRLYRNKLEQGATGTELEKIWLPEQQSFKETAKKFHLYD